MSCPGSLEQRRTLSNSSVPRPSTLPCARAGLSRDAAPSTDGKNSFVRIMRINRLRTAAYLLPLSALPWAGWIYGSLGKNFSAAPFRELCAMQECYLCVPPETLPALLYSAFGSEAPRSGCCSINCREDLSSHYTAVKNPINIPRI